MHYDYVAQKCVETQYILQNSLIYLKHKFLNLYQYIEYIAPILLEKFAQKFQHFT